MASGGRRRLITSFGRTSPRTTRRCSAGHARRRVVRGRTAEPLPPAHHRSWSL